MGRVFGAERTGMEIGVGGVEPWRECGGVEKERGRVRTTKRLEPRIGCLSYGDLGLVTAVVAKHAVCNCLGDSSVVSLGLWEILNS